jgi:hypothetical protein
MMMRMSQKRNSFGTGTPMSLSSLLPRVVATATGIVLVCCFPSAWADDTARVLPKGISAFTAAYLYYKDITERFDPSGKKEDRAIDYNTDLNSSVFPALAPLDPIVGGTATIGNSVVDSTLEYRLFGIGYSYGITDKLMFRLRVPYIESTNNVDGTVDASTANVGKNPAYPAAGPPIIPITAGGVPLTTDDVRDLLSQGLDVDGNGTVDIPGFGYEPFGSVSQSGFGDISFLMKYKFHDRGKWRLAAAGGARLGTGEPDDPDNLMDIPFGDGQSDVLFRFYADYRLSQKWLLNGVFRYDWQLPDKETVRVLDDVNQPVTANKERVDRNLGNIVELQFMTRYSFNPQWSTSLILSFTRKQKDEVDGDLGFDYTSLEDETDRESDIVYLKVEYSTIEKYRNKQARLPWIATLGFRDRYAGKNNEPVSQFVWVRLDFFF